MILSTTEQRLLNDYQRDFPLLPEPFRVIAEHLNTDSATVLKLLQRFLKSGVISRVGPVFRPNTMGCSTLATMSAPACELVNVANQISAYTEVNHNYEREHEFNLWFVVNAATAQRRDAVLGEIENKTGFNVMSLPLVCDYHIDLGFDLGFGDVVPQRPAKPAGKNSRPAALAVQNQELVSALQRGLPLIEKPYADIALRAGLTEPLVLRRIADLVRTGAIKRFGIVVRHHELGYRANAMCVWDVADDEVDEIGQMLAQKPYVTLCYRRQRGLPHWPYNLFCMIHGKHRPRVLKQIEELNTQFDLGRLPRSVLFSGRRFKQRGAFYRQQPDFHQGSRLEAHG